MKRYIYTVCAILFLCIFTGCQDTGHVDMLNDVIKVAGSTSVAPLMKSLQSGFEQAYKMNVEIQESGSSSGILSTIESASQLAMSSRELSEEEIQQGLEAIPIALDGIVIVTGLENPVENVNMDELTAIFTGKITNWSQVGGEDLDIIVVSREEGSGTRAAFEELTGMGANYDILPTALFENSTGAVKSNVMLAKNAIGYISMGTFDNRVKALTIDGVACDEENIKGGRYTLSRPYYLCVTHESDSNAKLLLDYVLSEQGQQIVIDSGYVSVN